MATSQIFGPAQDRIVSCMRSAVLWAVVSALGFLTSGCASTDSVASANNNSTAPDPEWFQSSDNPFHSD
jgi:hypothetical protein